MKMQMLALLVTRKILEIHSYIVHIGIIEKILNLTLVRNRLVRDRAWNNLGQTRLAESEPGLRSVWSPAISFPL